ncbi:MAG TPA: hypothetical protein VIP11_12570, partial [Gemmatimonadaceae bacterium]
MRRLGHVASRSAARSTCAAIVLGRGDHRTIASTPTMTTGMSATPTAHVIRIDRRRIRYRFRHALSTYDAPPSPR